MAVIALQQPDGAKTIYFLSIMFLITFCILYTFCLDLSMTFKSFNWSHICFFDLQPAGIYRNAASHVGGSSRLPSYCPPQGQYFGFSQTSVPMVRPANVPRVSKSTLSSSSSSVLSGAARPVGGYSRVTASSCLDPLPQRHFGSRLSKGYSSIASRPEIYGMLKIIVRCNFIIYTCKT